MKKILMVVWFTILMGLGNPRKWRIVRKYYKRRLRRPDLDNPSDLSEYIMAGILYKRNDAFAPYADKVAVKDYLQSKGLGNIVPQSLGDWSRAEDIEWEKLPEKFALKVNHGCGYNVFCNDSATFDRKQATKKLNRWARRNFSYIETHYSLIEPRIFAEEFLDDAGNYPVDYRIYCFRGEPAVIDATVCVNNDQSARFLHYIFDTDWNYLPQYSRRVYSDPERLPRPENFDKMLDYARTLAADFEFVRVDMYNFDGKIYFGELTFTPSGGGLAQFNDFALREMHALLAETPRGCSTEQ